MVRICSACGVDMVDHGRKVVLLPSLGTCHKYNASRLIYNFLENFRRARSSELTLLDSTNTAMAPVLHKRVIAKARQPLTSKEKSVSNFLRILCAACHS